MTQEKPPPRPGKRILIFGIVIVALLALFLPTYVLLQLHEREIIHEAKEKHLLSFKVIRVHADDKEVELVLPSYLVAINVSPLWARVNGYLSNFYADIGDRVKEGQLLAEIDTPDLDMALVQAQGELAGRIAKENIARITAERWTCLYNRNPEAISREEVDQMAAAYQAATADTSAARANVGRLQVLQNYKRIYAPFDGIITTRDIDLGQLITLGSNNNPLGYPEVFNQNKALFEIARCNRLRAFVDVPQAFFYLIEEGITAEITIPEYPGKKIAGMIDRNSGALDPIARTLLTQINIDNRGGELLPGLYAEVKFKFKPKKKSYIVPIAAVIIRSGPPYVAVVNESGRVHLKEVKIGRDYGTSMEIVEGLSDGDHIITNPTVQVKEGLCIEIE